MIIESKDQNTKKYYEEIMYISSNYYIFKKRPKTKTHSLTKVFIFYIILFFIFLILFLVILKAQIISILFVQLKNSTVISYGASDTEEVIKNTYTHPYEDENNDKTRKLLNS